MMRRVIVGFVVTVVIVVPIHLLVPLGVVAETTLAFCVGFLASYLTP